MFKISIKGKEGSKCDSFIATKIFNRFSMNIKVLVVNKKTTTNIL